MKVEIIQSFTSSSGRLFKAGEILSVEDKMRELAFIFKEGKVEHRIPVFNTKVIT